MFFPGFVVNSCATIAGCSTETTAPAVAGEGMEELRVLFPTPPQGDVAKLLESHGAGVIPLLAPEALVELLCSSRADNEADATVMVADS